MPLVVTAAALVWASVSPLFVLLAVRVVGSAAASVAAADPGAGSDSVGSEPAKLALVANSNCLRSEFAGSLGLPDRC